MPEKKKKDSSLADRYSTVQSTHAHEVGKKERKKVKKPAQKVS